MRHIRTKIFSKTARLAGVAALALTAHAAQAMPFDNVFIFGDSTTDSGNRHISEGFTFAPASLGYFDGRISNGPSLGDWLNFFASGEALATPSLNGGNNYSYAGARVRDNTNDLGPGSDTTPDLSAQVASFLTDNPGGPGSSDLVVISVGGNDIRDLTAGIASILPQPPAPPLPAVPPTPEEVFFNQIISAFVTDVVTLELAGAENILIMTPPDISRLPEAIAFAQTQADPDAILAQVRGASQQIAAFIQGALAVRPTAGASNLQVFDTVAFQDIIYTTPEDFGLPADINITDPCLGFFLENGSPDVDCSGFAFFDPIHAVTPFYEQTALAALDSTFGIRVSEPASLALLGLGLVGAVTLRRRKAA